MKVLLVSYHFPPDAAVGSIRPARVAEAFRDAGHDVHVIAPRIAGTARPAARGIHRVRRLPNARELALAARARLRGRATAAHGDAGGAGYVAPADVPQWKRTLVALALLPDDHQGFILPAFARALRLHARHRFDLLYTSGPPHSAHVVGLLFKWATRIRWAAEFRDPWTDNAARPRYAVSDVARNVNRWLERRTLAAADHIVAVSEAAGRIFAAKAPDRRDAVTVVRNGIAAAAAPPPARLPDGATRIVYLGNLYHRRDPRPLLHALARLRQGGGPDARRIELSLIGRCRWYHDVDIDAEARALGIDDQVRILDPIDRAEVPAAMARADVLLLLAQEQPLQVPQKLYEYFAARRPILAFADADGETALMLRAAGGHYVVDSDEPARLDRVLRRVLAGQPDAPPGLDPLEAWSADREMGRLLEAVGAGPAAGDDPSLHLLRDRDRPADGTEAQTTVVQ